MTKKCVEDTPNREEIVRERVNKSNQARRELTELFSDFEKRSKRRLALSSSFGQHIVFEGYDPQRSWIVNDFKSSFTSVIEAYEYFLEALNDPNRDN